MTERLVVFETAKLAKEKGLCNYFNKGSNYVSAFYSEDGISFEETEFQQEDCIIENRYFRPTQSLLQKWLREVHGIHINIDFGLQWGYQLIPIGWEGDSFSQKFIDDRNCLSFEESLEEGLKEALKKIKKNE